jgi:N-acetylneuraminic acid mutarotase
MFNTGVAFWVAPTPTILCSLTYVWSKIAQYTNRTPGLAAAASFTIGNYIYLGTGRATAAITSTQSFYRYDTINNVWSATATAPLSGTARNGAQGFALNGYGFILGGRAPFATGAPYYKDLWRYNPTTNSWAKAATYSGTTRGIAISFILKGEAYYGLGTLSGGAGEFKDFRRYNATDDAWYTTVGKGGGNGTYSIPDFKAGPRFYPGYWTNASGTKAYVSCGGATANVLQNDLWEFDIDTLQWTKKTSLPSVARENMMYGSIGTGIPSNKGYLIGGYTATIPMQDVWEYDILTDVWTQRTNLPEVLYNAHITAFNCSIYAGPGGGAAGTSASIWQQI